ncbi:unnamed protein product [Linum trigynum]
MINTLLLAACRFDFHSNLTSSSSPSSASTAKILSQSSLDFPKLTLSPVIPLNQRPVLPEQQLLVTCPSSGGKCSNGSLSPLE